jgi:hypothetical protein
LSAPRFEKISTGWRMVIEASSPIRFKHFTLKAPPRLAIDAKGASWSGTSQLDAPAPFVIRIRFGKQPDATRLVLDFDGQKIPNHQIDAGNGRLTITFATP